LNLYSIATAYKASKIFYYIKLLLTLFAGTSQIGGNKEIKSDFRLISATNRNLEDMVKDGTFRQDLLYRLQSMQIVLPPLRERKEDIKGLAIHRMLSLCEHYKIPSKGMSCEFIEALEAYNWPGNIRELFNVMEQIILTNKEETVLYPEHLPMNLRIKAKRALLHRQSLRTDHPEQITTCDATTEDFEVQQEGQAVDVPLPVSESMDRADLPARPLSFNGELPTLRELREHTVSAMEKQYIEELLKRSGPNLDLALRISGLSRARFYELLKKHDLPFR
jgi:two-component system NtrC family response regulator